MFSERYKTYKVSGSSQFETYNIMGNILADIAELIEEIRDSLALSYKGKYSAYIRTLTKLKSFQHLLASYYNVNKNEQKIMPLLFAIAEEYEKLNELKDGTKILGEIFETQLRILKREEALFPKKRKSMSFVQFAKDEAR